MRKIIHLLLLALMGCAPIPQNICYQIKPSVIKGGIRSISHGTAFQIKRHDRYHLVTAVHVVNGKSLDLPVAKVGYMTYGDVVEIQLSTPLDWPVLKVGPQPKVGEKLVAIGFDSEGSMHKIYGICTARGIMTSDMIGGMSGGPVLDSQGRVVGVVSLSFSTLGVSQYTPLEGYHE